MNEKKSPFGILCRTHRARLSLNETDMGVKIEELHYPLGKKSGSSRQSPVNMFEHSKDPPDTSRKQHRDPPLEYVEVCSVLFDLSPPEKYELFRTALDSSEKIFVDPDVFDPSMRGLLIDAITCLYLGREKIPEMEEECGSSPYNLRDEDRDLSKKWGGFKKALIELAEVLKNHKLELHKVA
jgi:hypothetical protein